MHHLHFAGCMPHNCLLSNVMLPFIAPKKRMQKVVSQTFEGLRICRGPAKKGLLIIFHLRISATVMNYFQTIFGENIHFHAKPVVTMGLLLHPRKCRANISLSVLVWEWYLMCITINNIVHVFCIIDK